MMDDGMLSQDEIDALLNVTDDNDDHEEKNEQQEDANNAYLSVMEKDTIGEIGNISLGNSATTLSTLLGKKVEITTSVVSIVKKTGFKEEFPFEHVSLQVNYIRSEERRVVKECRSRVQTEQCKTNMYSRSIHM